ncbi:RNA polymerase sigma factor RpoH [Motiliproteus sp. SC1-56]|uniref:RNA polymerase sigma factor RpoH n=1 Tax=Motiliproteus sp. SC1-56 TaxID=2799565 RepID=UPI001A8F80DA|nr:RNA polymerase sigma factor RpoH [Motiliproteus sp. SC1-56]
MSKALTVRQDHLPISLGSFEALVSYANRYPMVSEAEEQKLARQLRDQNDLDAAHRLILSHLRYVIKIARSYLGYGLPVTDITQEGTVGLMKAVRRFDPDMGVRLASFAVHWIRAEIYDYVLRNWRIVKVATTKAQRKLFFRLRQAKRSLGWLSAHDSEALAEELNVRPQDVREMEQRLSATDPSFHAQESASDDDALAEKAPEQLLGDERAEPCGLLAEKEAEVLTNAQLKTALATLNPRQQAIIARRWLGESKSTLSELAGEFGVSIERVRQIEKSALTKLNHLMGEAA